MWSVYHIVLYLSPWNETLLTCTPWQPATRLTQFTPLCHSILLFLHRCHHTPYIQIISAIINTTFCLSVFLFLLAYTTQVPHWVEQRPGSWHRCGRTGRPCATPSGPRRPAQWRTRGRSTWRTCRNILILLDKKISFKKYILVSLLNYICFFIKSALS